MSDLRTAIILDLTGNLGNQARRAGRDLEQLGARGTRALGRMDRMMGSVGRGLDRLGNRYTALLTGAGGIGAVRMVGNLERRFTRLGIQANRSVEEMDALKRKIYEVAQAPDIRVDPGEITAAIEEIIEKTGDIDFATANLRNLAAAIQATGAEGGAIGGIAAEFQKMGLVDPSQMLEALDILTVQGKEGAFTLQNLAALGPRVVTAYTAMGRTGLPAIREMGAALQVIRQGTGSSEQAATSFEALMRVLGNASKVKLLQESGIQVFDVEALKEGKQILRPINELMAEIVQRTKGQKTRLSLVFDDEALRAFNAAASEYQRLGRLESLDKFAKVQADGGTILSDSARAAKDFSSAMVYLSTSWQKFADGELAKPVGDLADFLNSLEPGTVERWMQVGKWLAIVGGGAVVANKFGAFRLAGMVLGRRGDGGLAAAAGGGSPIPVYVVNGAGAIWPGSGGTGVAGGAATATRVGGALRAVGAAAVPVAMYYGARELFEAMNASTDERLAGYDPAALARTMNDQARRGGTTTHEYREAERRLREMKGELKITIDQQGMVKVTRMESDNLQLDVDTGRLMLMGGGL